MKDLVENISFEFTEERSRYFKAIDDQIAGLDSVCATLMREALRNVEDAFKVEGSDRIELLRAARTQCHDVTIDAAGRACDYAWFLYGWLTWRATGSASEAAQAFGVASELNRKRGDELTWLSFRYRAATIDDDAEAARCLTRASEIRPTAACLVDAAAAWVRLGRIDEARRSLVRCQAAEPLSIVAILGDGDCANAGDLVLKVIASAAGQTRAETLKRIHAWARTVQRVREAEQVSGARLDVPEWLLNGMNDMRDKVNGADLLSACLLCDEVKLLGKEALETAQRNLMLEHRKRSRAVEGARQLAGSNYDGKDPSVQAAKLVCQQAIDGARAELAESILACRGAQTSATWSLAVGVAALVAYLLIASAVAAHDVQIGLNTALGKLIAATASAPIAIGLVSQVATGVRRVATEVETNVQIRRAEAALAEATAQAETRYRGRVGERREALAKAEEALLNTEKGLLVLAGA